MLERRSTGVLAAAAVAVMLGACGGGSDKEPEPEPEAPQMKKSTRNDLQWKRYRAIERDLMGGLELEADQVCNELGRANCVNEVHLVSLGGHDPFATGLFEPLAAPLATTPIALDRVVLSACARRAQMDTDADPGTAKVFSAMDMRAGAPAADSAQVDETATTLYRRLLARDPLAEEIAIVRELVVDDAGAPVSATHFATMACFAIGTTTEFLFF